MTPCTFRGSCYLFGHANMTYNEAVVNNRLCSIKILLNFVQIHEELNKNLILKYIGIFCRNSWGSE